MDASAFISTNSTDANFRIARDPGAIGIWALVNADVPNSRFQIAPAHRPRMQPAQSQVTPANRHALRQCLWAFIRLGGGHQSAETRPSSPPYGASRRYVLLGSCGIHAATMSCTCQMQAVPSVVRDVCQTVRRALLPDVPRRCRRISDGQGGKRIDAASDCPDVSIS